MSFYSSSKPSFKLVVFTLSLSVAGLAQAYCPNSGRLANDAAKLQRSSNNLAISANRAWAYGVERAARSVGQGSSRLQVMARHNRSSCVQLKNQYNRIAREFQNLQRTYNQSRDRYNTYLNRDYRDASIDFRNLSTTVRSLQRAPRNPRYPTPPTNPRRPLPPRR